jgi:hypothetical protein
LKHLTKLANDHQPSCNQQLQLQSLLRQLVQIYRLCRRQLQGRELSSSYHVAAVLFQSLVKPAGDIRTNHNQPLQQALLVEG